MTKQVLADHLGLPLAVDKATEQKVVQYHADMEREMSENKPFASGGY